MTGKISSLPFGRGGLGWGNLRDNGDSITCVYTVAFTRGELGLGKTFDTAIMTFQTPSNIIGSSVLVMLNR